MAVMTTLELTREDHPRLMLSQDELPIEVRTGLTNLKYNLLSGNDFWSSVRSGQATVKCTGLNGETLGEMTDEFFDEAGWLTKLTVEEFAYMWLGDKFYD
jgi:hypothetical protein